MPAVTRVCAATKFPIVTNLWEKPDAEGSLTAMLFAVVHWNKKEERWKWTIISINREVERVDWQVNKIIMICQIFIL